MKFCIIPVKLEPIVSEETSTFCTDRLAENESPLTNNKT